MADRKYIQPTQEEREKILDDCIYHFNTLSYEAQRMVVNQICCFKVYLNRLQEMSGSNVIKPDFKVFKKENA